MMDALSHLLDDVHFCGAEYLYINGLENWRCHLRKQTMFYVVLTGTVQVQIAQQQHSLLRGISFFCLMAHNILFLIKHRH